MPLRVRVKNFQSIEDAEIVIDGFVVICGPNNSGKTALMRAIRGLFNNAAPGSYLRNGANFLSVEIEFDDGTTVLWEKGWEKPGKKGAAVNRYTINGYQISSVGRGVPPEVEALGVKHILAGNNPIWPQVADQFDGTLFLVNKTGAVVAEALSDVERVGKLTDALRLSEKDKRSANSELKVRRDDLKDLQNEVKRYAGLDKVGLQVQSLSALKNKTLEQKARLETSQALQARLLSAKSAWEFLKDYSVTVPSEPKNLRDISSQISDIQQYRDRLSNLQRVSEELKGFEVPLIPSPEGTLSLRDSLRESRNYRDKLLRISSLVEAFAQAQPPKFSDTTKLEKIPRVLSIVRGFKSRNQSISKTLSEIEADRLSLEEQIRENEHLVNHLLGERGYCPTCKTVHSGEVLL